MNDYTDYIMGGIATSLVAVFGWVLNVNTRVNVQKQAHEDLKELISVKLDNVLKQVDLRADMTAQRLSRIEKALNGYMNHE